MASELDENLYDQINENDYSTDVKVVAIGPPCFPMPDDEWSESEIYCKKDELKFLKKSKISPLDCVIIKKKSNQKITLSDAFDVINKLVDLHFCACLGPAFYEIDIYTYKDKTIIKLKFDTESG